MAIDKLYGFISILIILIVSPLFIGMVNKFKAIFIGKIGAPILQPYYELKRLYKKETINSQNSSFISRVAPVINFSAIITSALLLPVGYTKPVFNFDGDIILFAYLLGFSRFLQILAALDIGSSFEGMGAAREATFALFAEPIFFFSIGSIAFISGHTNIYEIYKSIQLSNIANDVFIVICSISVFILAVTECSRMPVDDPNTHLELTMIHEVMILDNSGIDLFLYQYSSYIKLFIYTVLEVLFFPVITQNYFGAILILTIGSFVLSATLALVETITSRYKMKYIPQYLLFAMAIGILNLLIYTFAK